MTDVTMYSSDNCGYCVLAKRLLAKRGIAPREINLDMQPALRADLMARTGRRTVPQIFIGDQHIGGFDELALLERQGKLEAMLRG